VKIVIPITYVWPLAQTSFYRLSDDIVKQVLVDGIIAKSQSLSTLF